MGSLHLHVRCRAQSKQRSERQRLLNRGMRSDEMVGRRGGPRRRREDATHVVDSVQQDAPYCRSGTYMSNIASKSNACERRACLFAPMHRTFVQTDATGGNARYVKADANLEEVTDQGGKEGLLPRGPRVRVARVPLGTARPTPLPTPVKFTKRLVNAWIYPALWGVD